MNGQTITKLNDYAFSFSFANSLHEGALSNTSCRLTAGLRGRDTRFVSSHTVQPVK